MFPKACYFSLLLLILKFLLKRMMKNRSNVLTRVWRFYEEGFKNMSGWGKQVWIVILLKLFIMFFVLKLFFFPNFLKTNFETDKQRSEHVLENLTNTK